MALVCISPETRAVVWSYIVWASDQLGQLLLDTEAKKAKAYHEASAGSAREHGDGDGDGVCISTHPRDAALDAMELGALDTSFASVSSLDSGCGDCSDADAGGSAAECAGTRQRRRFSSVCAVAFRWHISVADAQELCATFEAAQSEPATVRGRAPAPARERTAELQTRGCGGGSVLHGTAQHPQPQPQPTLLPLPLPPLIPAA